MSGVQRSRRPGLVAGAISLAATCGLTSVAHGDEWYLESQMQTQASANDNLTLSSTSSEGVVGGVASPQVKLGHRSPTLDLNFTGRVDLNGYGVNSSLSSIDERLTIGGTYTGERSKIAVGAEYNRDTLFDNVEDNSGQNVDDVRVNKLSFSPSWSFQASELDLIDLNASLLDQTYGASQDDLTDYQYYTGAARWLHMVSETDTLISGGSYGRYDPDDEISSGADIFNLQLGWLHQFSDNLQLQAVGGPSLTIGHGGGSVGEGRPNGSNDLGYNADVALSYDLSDVASLRATYARSTEPTGSGATRERDRIGLALSYRLSELVTANLTGRYIGNEVGSGDSEDDFKRYLSLEPQLTWRIARDTDFAVAYRFQRQEFRAGQDPAMSNAVYLTFTYRLPRWSWSD